MRKLILLVVVIFVCNGLFAQGIEFENGSFEEALVKARKENKLIFMDCYTSWCGPCKYLSKNIFPQKEVGDFFNKHFVNVKIDCEKGEGPKLASKYGVSSYPTLLFIDVSGNVVHKLVGGMPAEDLIEGAKSALDPNLRIGTLKEKYKQGNRDSDFLMTYLIALKRQYDKKNMSIVAKEIIKQSSLEKFMTKDLFFVVMAANLPFGTNEFNYLLENKDRVKQITKPNEYQAIFGNAIYDHLQQYANKCKSLSELNNEIQRCNNLFEMKGLAGMKKYLEGAYYIANNQLQKWFDFKLEEVNNKKGDHDISVVYRIGEEVLNTPKLTESKEIVAQTLKLAHEIADESQGLIMGNLMLAKLYLFTKEKEKALNHFKTFFEANEKAGGNNKHPTVSDLKIAIDML